MLKYEVEIYENHRGSLLINVPEEISLVADLLLADIQEDGTHLWLSLVNKVLSRESCYEEITGNACTMEVEYEMTKIVFEYAEAEYDDHCLIETEELKKIFMLWDEAIEKKYGESN
ncbi:hypothetical protein [Priestia koreensis]|uniref:hypothetical protein n=1 Tax=Priestia koreensis TaxID=284581 RepID=UPI00203DBB70|nr:hypothetical protein [Priestia koreensis]MCM3005785.1 hypothetical protein [Priestia koreensis]